MALFLVYDYTINRNDIRLASINILRKKTHWWAYSGIRHALAPVTTEELLSYPIVQSNMHDDHSLVSAALIKLDAACRNRRVLFNNRIVLAPYGFARIIGSAQHKKASVPTTELSNHHETGNLRYSEDDVRTHISKNKSSFAFNVLSGVYEHVSIVLFFGLLSPSSFWYTLRCQ